MLSEIIKKHGSAIDAVLGESLEHMPVGLAMSLIAAMAREVAAAERARSRQK